MARQRDATWLPEGWTMDVFPAGWTLPHLEAWFRYALYMAKYLYPNRPDIRPDSDESPSYAPTPRELVAHGHLIVRHLGLAGSPAEPREKMDQAGCIADLRDVLVFLRRSIVGGGQRVKPKGRRGRKPHIDPKADKRLCEHWKAAKASGASRDSFCRGRGIKISDLTAAQDREKYRRSRAES
jgi:hypothetical protein